MKLPPFSSPGLFLLALGHLVAVNGQSPTLSPTETAVTPLPTTPPLGGMAYGLDKRMLYIQGGNQSDNTVSTEFYKLDLSVPWSILSPAWSTLPNNDNMNVSGVSGGFLSSGAFVVHSNNPPGVFSYDILSSKWTKLYETSKFAKGGPQVVTATDNRTYFLSDGFVVDPQSTPQAPHEISKNQTLPSGLAVAWSSKLKKVVTVVKTQNKLDAQTLDLEAPSLGRTTLAQANIHMLVENDPNTFLLYGGEINSSATDELWSLNIDAAQWKKLSSSGKKRHSMACAVSGDTLVVWGGYNDEHVVDTTPLLYNLATDRWNDTTEFVPTPTETVNPPVSVTPPKIRDPGPNVAAIVGGVAGGVVLIALVGFFLYKRRACGRGNKNADLSRNALASKNDSGHSAEKEEFIEEARERSLPSLPPAQLQQQQQQTLVLPRGGSPAAAHMGYPAAVPMQQPPLPMHSRPMTSQSYTASVDNRYSGSVPVIHSPFEDVNEATAKHPLLTPVSYTPTTQHQPRPQDNEVVDLMPITRSEAGSLHSRTNSVSSRHSLGRKTTVRTAGGRNEEEEEGEEEEEELDYL
ncbi:hypothetical protein BG006_006294 [Podila minutissima]|uniref:Galactose oxidase n=1 Tax=Podila minutissima TaxID=64525 RepID=A0A9P5VLR4_9FUNG|nr:hypothetical protein BG006_006294 [Podila minutissima]